MANFRVTAQGNGAEISRLGHSGINATLNTWKAGINVYARKEEKETIIGKRGGKTIKYHNVFYVSFTRGSAGSLPKSVFSITEEEIKALMGKDNKRVSLMDLYLRKDEQ